MNYLQRLLQVEEHNLWFDKSLIVSNFLTFYQILQVGTPICIPQREFIDIGRIASIENNHKPVDYAKKGQKIAIKVAPFYSTGVAVVLQSP